MDLPPLPSLLWPQRLGPNLRVLVLLLLPLPLLLLPLALCLGSFLFSAGVGFFWPLGATVAVGSLLPAQQLLEVAVMEPIDLARVGLLAAGGAAYCRAEHGSDVVWCGSLQGKAK